MRVCRFKAFRSLAHIALFAIAHLLVMSAPCASYAQEEETQSVGDLARAARAHRSQVSQTEPRSQQPPLSAAALVGWQIAGVRTADILSELQVRGIAFAPDDTHLSFLKDAQLAPEILSALPRVPQNVSQHPGSDNNVVLSPALLRLAQTFSAKDYKASRSALETLVQNTDDAILEAALGNVDALIHDPAAAKAAFLRAEKLDPDFVYPHIRLAQIYYSSEEESLMAAEAKKALALSPDNASARKYLAISISMEASQASGAASGSGAEDLSDLKVGNNEAGRDANKRANELAEQGNWPEAERSYRDAIELDPQVAAYYYNLGHVYSHWGPEHTDQALAAYKQAKILAPRNLAIRQNIGYCLCQAHRYAEAVTEFRELLAIDMYWNLARPCLAGALNALGRNKEAFQVMQDYTRYKALDDSGDDGTADAAFNDGPHL